MNKFSIIRLPSLFMGCSLAVSVSAMDNDYRPAQRPVVVHRASSPAHGRDQQQFNRTPLTEEQSRSTLRAIRDWADEVNQTIYDIKIKRNQLIKKLKVTLKITNSNQPEWTLAKAKGLPEFRHGSVLFVGSINNNQFSLSRVTADSISSIMPLSPIADMKKIINHFRKRSDQGTPVELTAIKLQMLRAIHKWINANPTDPALQGDLFHLVIYQTGEVAVQAQTCRLTMWQAEDRLFQSFDARLRADLVKKRVTKVAFEDYLEKFNKPIKFKLRGTLKKLNVKLDFLPKKYEAELSGKDFFEYNWPQNQDTLGLIAEATGVEDFTNLHGFTAVNVGAYSTEIYYVGQGGLITKQFDFGTKKFEAQNIQKLLETIKERGKPVIFFNAISYAVVEGTRVPGVPVEDMSILDLNGARKCTNDDAGQFANALREATRAAQLEKAYVYLITKKECKLLNKWPNALAQLLSEFENNKLGFVSDFGTRSFSNKVVENRKVTELDLVEHYWPGLEKYADEADIVAWFRDPKDFDIHPRLEQYIHRIIASALKYLEDNFFSVRAIREQDEFNLVIRKSGNMQKLHADTNELFDVIKATRIADNEEKKGR